MTQQAEILPMETGKVAVYNPFRAQLAELKKQNSSLVFEYETPKGNKDARSHIHKLRQTKSAIDKARKAEKEESLNYGRLVDAEAKLITADLEEMIDVHQKVIDEIEAREKEQKAFVERGLKHIEDCGNGLIGGQLQPFGLLLYELKEKIVIDDRYGEFKHEALKARDAAIQKLETAMEAAAQRQAEQAELELLRTKTAQLEQAAREEQIRKDAEEKAKAEAKVEREAAERMAVEVRKAEELKAKEREDALKLEAENAERERLDAIARAEQAEADRIAAAQRAQEEAAAAAEKAERDQQEAIKKERERIEAEASARLVAEKAEKERREADFAHKAAINAAAVTAMTSIVVEDRAVEIIELIAAGKVPHVMIAY